MKRLLCCALIVAALPVGKLAAYDYADVTLDYVAARAEQRAHKPFHSPSVDLPDFLRPDKLDYDKYNQIAFRDEDALWANEPLPFRIEFFHPGYIYHEPIRVYEFTLIGVQQIRFVQDWFNYHGVHLPRQIPADTGYAGFKVLYPLNETNKWDELGAFLGASYFRLLGKGLVYGMDSRGLALNSGEPDEEFPIFTDWWLGKPSKGDDRLKMYAILDSVSCVAAYEFILIPGDVTVANIEARLYFREPDKIHAADPNRKPIKTVGLAPLTSMFWFGKASERRFDDYREEVHDSDGLLMEMGNGEVLWRPLNNPPKNREQVFAVKDIRGFGLLQRSRSFSDYQDLFRRYDKTPSVWVQPQPNGPWSEGEIHLVEIATENEWNDNIVAFWNPKEMPQPLKPYSFAYTLKWGLMESDMKLSFDKDTVVSTRIGVDARDPKVRQFAIDFAGPRLAKFTQENPPQAITSCSANAGISDSQIFPLPDKGHWRVILKLEPHNQEPVDIRCTLQKGEEVLTETWTYHWSPP